MHQCSHVMQRWNKIIKDFFEGQELEIWYGDLDLTLDTETLKKIQSKIGKPIIVTTEHGHDRLLLE